MIGAPFSVFVVAWDEDLSFFLFLFFCFYKLGVLGRGRRRGV